MTGTLRLARLEMMRVLRNKRYLMFTIGLPVVLYLAIGRTKSPPYGGDFRAFSMVPSVPASLIVLALGRFYGNVHLAGWKGFVIAAAIWLGSMTFAALAVAI